MSGDGLTTDFPLVEQGYDPNQVDQYLATQMLQLREEAEVARNRITELEGKLSLAKEAEEALQLTMVMAKRAATELLEQAKVEADEILSEARREAFVLMTEARTDTDSSVVEGKAIIAAARDEALSIISDVESETARLIAERDAELAKLREQYESESSSLIDRINTLRAIADDVEAKTTGKSVPAAPTPPPTAPELPSPTNEGRTADTPRKVLRQAPPRFANRSPAAARQNSRDSAKKPAAAP